MSHDRSGLWAEEPLDEFHWEPPVSAKSAVGEPRVEFVGMLPGTGVLDSPDADVAVVAPRVSAWKDRRELWLFASGSIVGALVCFLLVSLTTSAEPQSAPLPSEPVPTSSAPAPVPPAVSGTPAPERSTSTPERSTAAAERSTPAPIAPPAVEKASQARTLTANRQDARQVAVPSPVPPSKNGAFVGSLRIDSTPQGARVFINRLPVGVTPLVVRDLRAGSHAVRVEADGHLSWSSAIRVIADRQTSVHTPLTPLTR